MIMVEALENANEAPRLLVVDELTEVDEEIVEELKLLLGEKLKDIEVEDHKLTLLL